MVRGDNLQHKSTGTTRLFHVCNLPAIAADPIAMGKGLLRYLQGCVGVDIIQRLAKNSEQHMAAHLGNTSIY